MSGFFGDIEKLTVENNDFRRVIYTAPNSQLVLMSLHKGEDIGEEVHHLDQFFRIEVGMGQAVVGGTVHEIKDGSVVIVPVGVKHNIINTSDVSLKLYTIYSPPNHRDGVVHATKAEAEADEESYDGKTTE